MKKSLFTSLMLGILISEPLTAQTGADNPFGNALIPDMIDVAKLLQKSEMRKDIVIELSYKGFG